MASGVERIASCACGKVRFKATGAPIVNAVCYCADCQAGGRQLEAAGARRDFRDERGGTGYATYRNDRFECLEGAALVQGLKLRDDADTTRFMATCCQSGLYLKYGPGWWTSLFRVRLGNAAPPLDMRNNTGSIENSAMLPRDVPTYKSFPVSLFYRLVHARIGMWLGV